MTQIRSELNPKLQSIVNQVQALRRLTDKTNFHTNRSQHALLVNLNATELAQIATVLYPEREKQ